MNLEREHSLKEIDVKMKEKFKFINLFCCLIFLICTLSCGSDYSKYSSDTEESSSEEGTGDVTDSADTVYLAEVSNIVWSAATNVEGGYTLVSIKWTAPADEDLQGFLITYSKTDSVDTPVSFTVEGKNKTEISMEADASYSVTVKSVDTSGKQSSGLTEIINISSRYSLICTVTLESFETKAKIPVIKVVREVTGLGLGEAKALVEKAPATIKEGLTSTEADEIIKKLTDAGGKASKKVKKLTDAGGKASKKVMKK